MTSFHCLTFSATASCNAFTAGISRCFTLTAAAMFIAEGNVSLDDCDMLTWSLGCTGALLPSGVPASWQQRLEMTSFTFMLNCVPLPVIHTCCGNMSSCWPARISSQVWTMSRYRLSSSRFPAWLALAAPFFSVAYAVIISRGIRSFPMLKCSSERCVWAPHKRSAATFTSPSESVSTRNWPLVDLVVFIFGLVSFKSLINVSVVIFMSPYVVVSLSWNSKNGSDQMRATLARTEDLFKSFDARHQIWHRSSAKRVGCFETMSA